MTLQVYHQLLESNGKTIRENNLAIGHCFPLGALVEVDSEGYHGHGLRLFVVGHSRDCDGDPLYDLSFRKDAAELEEQAKKQFETQRDALNSVIFAEKRGAILRNIGQSSLKPVN